MSDVEQVRTGRFGAATPGVRPSPPSLEALLSAAEPPARRWSWSRNRVLAAAGVVVLAAGAFAGGHFTAGHAAPASPTELMVTGTALPAGTRLTEADLRAVPVQPGASRPAGTMTRAAAGGMIGLVLKQPVPAGTFLQRSLLTSAGALPDAAHALVGLALKPGQLPVGGLAAGQQVLVVLLRTSSGGAVARPVPLVITTVWNMQGPDSSGDTLATVVVPAHDAALLSGYAAQADVALVATAVRRGNARTVIRPTPTPQVVPHPSSSAAGKAATQPTKKAGK
jgi:SAF domain